MLHGTKRCIQHLEHTLFCSIGIFCNYASGCWHEAWSGKLWVSNVLQPFKISARQLCLHYFSACGEIPGLKVFVTASGTVEQDTCSIIVDCRLKSPDKVEKIYSFFNKTRLRHWWVCLLQTKKKHNVQRLTIHMCRPTFGWVSSTPFGIPFCLPVQF